MKARFLPLLVVVAAGALAGCDGGESSSSHAEGAELLETLDSVAVDGTGGVLAYSQASAPAVFYQSYLPILSADVAGQFGGTCPAKTESGSTTTYEGGCSASGTEWVGTATVKQTASGSEIRYDGFGMLSTTSCGGASYATASEWNGVMKMGATSPAAPGAFDVDLRVDLSGPNEQTCATAVSAVAFVYEGSFDPNGPDGDGDGEPDAQIFSGSGEVGIDVVSGGDPAVAGRVAAETVDEVVVTSFTTDTAFSLCQTEALSGTTTLEGDGHTTEILYDGDTDCDAASTVNWTLDGASQGEVSGIGCHVTGVGAPAVGPALLALAALAGARLRRRR